MRLNMCINDARVNNRNLKLKFTQKNEARADSEKRPYFVIVDLKVLAALFRLISSFWISVATRAGTEGDAEQLFEKARSRKKSMLKTFWENKDHLRLRKERDCNAEIRTIMNLGKNMRPEILGVEYHFRIATVLAALFRLISSFWISVATRTGTEVDAEQLFEKVRSRKKNMLKTTSDNKDHLRMRKEGEIRTTMNLGKNMRPEILGVEYHFPTATDRLEDSRFICERQGFLRQISFVPIQNTGEVNFDDKREHKDNFRSRRTRNKRKGRNTRANNGKLTQQFFVSRFEQLFLYIHGILNFLMRSLLVCMKRRRSLYKQSFRDASKGKCTSTSHRKSKSIKAILLSGLLASQFSSVAATVSFIPIGQNPHYCYLDVSKLPNSCGNVSTWAIHCIPDDAGQTGISCIEKIWVPKGQCPFFSKSYGVLDYQPCAADSSQCASDDYFSDQAFKYPGCMINGSTVTQDISIKLMRPDLVECGSPGYSCPCHGIWISIGLTLLVLIILTIPYIGRMLLIRRRGTADIGQKDVEANAALTASSG